MAMSGASGARAARSLGADPDALLGLRQVHGRDVVTVTQAWPIGHGQAADAMVTDRPGLALGIVTADCAPVLFADPGRNIAGAAHAGWRGAAGGKYGAIPVRILYSVEVAEMHCLAC